MELTAMDKKANFLALCLLDSLEDENMPACELLIIKYNANASLIIAERGIAAIHYACGMQNAEMADKMIDLMISKGADPNVRSGDNMTPLHVAAIWGRANIFKTLLKYGAEIDAVDDDKKTPILYAIFEKQIEIVKIVQNYIFEKKYEERKKSMMLGVNKINTPKIVHNLNLAKNMEDENKFTPNRINYNFDKTSPYYINITHRKLRQKTDDNDLKDDDDVPSTLSLIQNERKENLFKLTEENVNEYSKNSTVGKSRNSYINIWREKVARSKNRTSILRSFNDIDALLNGITSNDNLNFTNVSLNLDGSVPKKPLRKKFSDTSFGKLLERLKNPNKSLTDDCSFVTAEDGQGGECGNAGNTTDADDNTNANPNCNNSSETNSKDCNKPTTFIRTPKDDDFIVQMTEAYVHTDDDNGLVWYEKRVLANPVTGGNKDVETVKLNKTNTSFSTDFSVPADYDTEDLRAELTNFGEPPGPITKSTKRLYTKRLMRYKKNPMKIDLIKRCENGSSYPKFSIELELTFRKIEWFNRIPEYIKLESKMSCQFQGSSGNQNKKWREGHIKTSFIYLLIDPRISNNLPGDSASMKNHEVWQTFLLSIFYVGKGKSSRPYSHLYDAMKTFSKNYLKNNARNQDSAVSGESAICLLKSTGKQLPDSKKLERILDIWKSEMGVVCLHVFHNIIPAEAFTREASIIDCLGLHHLTNLKRGDYYGAAQSWTMRMRKQLGIALLLKSMQIFLAEGESQLMPSDLI